MRAADEGPVTTSANPAANMELALGTAPPGAIPVGARSTTAGSSPRVLAYRSSLHAGGDVETGPGYGLVGPDGLPSAPMHLALHVEPDSGGTSNRGILAGLSCMDAASMHGPEEHRTMLSPNSLMKESSVLGLGQASVQHAGTLPVAIPRTTSHQGYLHSPGAVHNGPLGRDSSSSSGSSDSSSSSSSCSTRSSSHHSYHSTLLDALDELGEQLSDHRALPGWQTLRSNL